MKVIVDVYAHCDLPCGVYNPQQARIEAEAVLETIKKLNVQSDDEYFMTRGIFIKEKVCEEVKRHINILHSDYFRDEHFKKYENLHHHIHSALQFARKAKSSNDIGNAESLLKEIDAISEIFWETKKS
jgi:nickel superoxide dismutase